MRQKLFPSLLFVFFSTKLHTTYCQHNQEDNFGAPPPGYQPEWGALFSAMGSMLESPQPYGGPQIYGQGGPNPYGPGPGPFVDGRYGPPPFGPDDGYRPPFGDPFGPQRNYPRYGRGPPPPPPPPPYGPPSNQQPFYFGQSKQPKDKFDDDSFDGDDDNAGDGGQRQGPGPGAGPGKNRRRGGGGGGGGGEGKGGFFRKRSNRGKVKDEGEGNKRGGGGEGGGGGGGGGGRRQNKKKDDDKE